MKKLTELWNSTSKNQADSQLLSNISFIFTSLTNGTTSIFSTKYPWEHRQIYMQVHCPIFCKG